MTPAQVLSKAADILQERGWTQGIYEDADGCLCLDGALRYAVAGAVGSFTSTDRYHEYVAASQALEAVIGTRNVIRWNDSSVRTQASVVRALRAAAERAA